MRNIALGLLSAVLCQSAVPQTIDHWETAVLNTNSWQFILPVSEPASDWNEPGFDDDAWITGIGGIGYGDDDDNTLIPLCISVYMRTVFTIEDLSTIGEVLFHMDYDDGFVAYLNGIEIARGNAGYPGEFIPYNYGTDALHEAVMYMGGQPEQFDVNTDLLLEGENVLAIQVHNTDPGSSDLSSNAFLSFGITDAGTYFYPTPAWFVAPFASSTLPLVFINTTEDIPDEPKIIADMGVIWGGDGAVNYVDSAAIHYNGKVAIEIRGSSSQSFPKKSYSIELQDSAGMDLNFPLLGLPADDNWILYGPYTDKTFLRDVLTFYLGGRQGWYEPRFKYCEVFVNNSYQGIYVLLEKIKIHKNRVDINEMTIEDNEGEEVTGGYVVKVDRNDYASPVQDYFYSPYPGTGWPYDVMYVYVDPKPELITTDQQNYIEDYIISFEDAMNSPDKYDLENGYHKYIDINSFVDYLMINEMSRNVDAYRLSTYLYKNNDKFGGLLYAGPLWDFNLAWGNADYCTAWPVSGFFTDCGTGPAWWYDLFDDVNFQNRLNCRWNELRDGAFHTDSIKAWIDAQVAILGDAADRNYDAWPILGTYVWPNYYIGATFEDEVYYLKSWITGRMNWIDANMPGDPVTCDVAGTYEISINEINYNSDNLNDADDWVELHNYGGTAIDISSWKLKNETAFDSYVIPGGTVLDPGEYLVLVGDVDTFLMIHPTVTNYIGPFNWKLDNMAGSVKLEDNIGNIIRQVNYIDSLPWPKGPDGFGPTLQIDNETGSENDPANWFAGCVLGSPGVAYAPCNYNPVIDEINYNSLLAYNPGDWVELWNSSASTVDLSGWILKDMNNGNAFVFPNGTTMLAGHRLVVSDSLVTFGEKFPWVTNVIGEPNFHFSNGGDAIRLYDATGRIRYSVRYNDKAPWPLDADGIGFTLESTNPSDNPNLAENWVAGCLYGSPGTEFTIPCPDAIETIEPVAVTVMPNPFDNTVQIIINSILEIEEIFITDITGKQVKQFPIAQQVIYWDGTNNENAAMSAGIYYLNLITRSGEHHSTELVKIK